MKFKGFAVGVRKHWIVGSLVTLGNRRFIVEDMDAEMVDRFIEDPKIDHRRLFGNRFVEVDPETIRPFI